MTIDTSFHHEQKIEVENLGIKEAQLIFNTSWEDLIAEVGLEHIEFPKEIFWLNGAPGAGKGTNTRFIMENRDFSDGPIVISDLLKSDEAKKRMDAGILVGDREVFGLLLRKLMDPVYANGVVVDGFPRTQIQVELVRLFYDKLRMLGSASEKDVKSRAFSKPNFHIIVLFIDEAESVRRQLYRGKMDKEHNEKVKSSGVGEAISIRKTDLDEALAHERYRTFKDVTYDALKSLQNVFNYHFINAQGSIKEVQERIIKELKYQSSLELNEKTYKRINRIPVSRDIVKYARQQLVARLDDYEMKHSELFERVISLIEKEFMPTIREHAISGKAYVSTENPIFEEPLALPMLIDIFSERGYHTAVDVRLEEIPERVDRETFEIIKHTKKVYRMRFRFAGSDIRRGN